MPDERGPTIHMIGHGHIDPTWLWRWTEGCEEVRATFRSALARMRETPEFKFTASSACFYQWMKSTEPELYEEIKDRIHEGRWEIAGGFWIEPDCNVPCGESFVRHGLYSQRFFQREFGKRARAGFNPDSFGHTGTLPQILKKLGIDFYCYMRPEPDLEMKYPDGATFWWRARDGSRVLASQIPVSYSGTDVRTRIEQLLRFPHLNKGQEHILGFFGVGNHGGGPTKRAIADIIAMQSEPGAPQLCFSTLVEYFDALAHDAESSKLPEVSTGLQYHARGCYSAHAQLKRLHRDVEHTIMTAERFATAAWLLNAQDYPHDQFEKAWKDLLYNQFHDILAGTSLESSYHDTRDQLGAARHRAHVIINDAVQAIARDIDTTADGNTIVVINPLTWPVEQPVTVQPIIDRELEKPIHLVDDSGNVVPLQQVQHERPGSHRYTFTADVPATGYRIFHARSGHQAHKLLNRLDTGPDFIENERWRIEIDRYDGCLCRLLDKRNHTEVLKRGASLISLVDSSDTWSHDADAYRIEAGKFGHARLELLETGPVLATVRATSRWNNSTAIQDYTLYRDLEIIDCRFRINWQDRHHVLKATFDTTITQGVLTVDAAYGHEERPADGTEQPCQQWVDLTGLIDGLNYGFAVLNNGQYGFDASNGALRMTLLRSPVYAHHDPHRIEATAAFPVMDQGWHDIRLRLVPHLGPWQDTRIPKLAWELNVPLVAHHESAHPGFRGPRAQLMGTEADNVLLSVLKQSEEGADIVVRGYETAGRPAKTALHFPYFHQKLELDFAPHEIKSIRINPHDWTMKEVNLIEE